MADTTTTAPAPTPTTTSSAPASTSTEIPTPSATSNTQGHTYLFDITMTCSGCSGAIERVLKRLDGVKSFQVSLPEQSAEISAAEELGYETVLEKIKKTGKTVNSGWADGVERGV
ncbi:MAG: Cytosolic copper metallochaperone [Chrysothrix sp. TS-e1954]|nr:MAG: Cytosolic copper metallochaperone [Chrysothrix sp. TS-e1954]